LTVIQIRGAARRRDLLAWQIGRAVRDTSITNLADFIGEDEEGDRPGRREAPQSAVEMAHNLAVWRAIYGLQAIHVPNDEE